MPKLKAQNNKINKINLENRIITTFALLEFSQLGKDEINKNDIQELYNKVEELKSKTFKDEHIFELVSENKIDEINSLDSLKERIKHDKIILGYKQMGYFGLSSGKLKEHNPEEQEILATILHENNIKNADEFASQIFNQTLDEENFKQLQNKLSQNSGNLKKHLSEDYAIYTSMNSSNPAISTIAPDIEEYIYNKNKGLEYNFEVRKEDKSFREKLRKPFQDKAKPDFLKIYGTFMQAGSNPEFFGNKNYQTFSDIMAQTKENIDNVLMISTQGLGEDEAFKLRKATFLQKSEEIYYKTVAGILTQKYKSNQITHSQTDWPTYIKTLNERYIPALLNGENKMAVLAFQDANDNSQFTGKKDEYRKNKEMRDETAEEQIISIHHIFTVGSAHDVSAQLLPTDTSQNEQLNTCSYWINNPSNFIFVIGKDKHQSLEAKDTINFTKSSNSTIFASNINCLALKNILTKLPKAFQDKFNANIKLDSSENKSIESHLKFSEHKDIQNLRAKISTPEKHISLLNKLTRYY